MPNVVLCMIVKDEGAVIERCLAAALPHVDGWLIVDTGSTDDTTARILERAGSKPGHLTLFEPFSDFATNRTSAAQAARAWAVEAGLDVNQTYLLWLNADMRLAVAPDFRASELSEPCYALLEQEGGRCRWRTTLGRLSETWRHEGVAGGDWLAASSVVPAPLASLWLETSERSERRAEKTARDLALLERRLALEPGDTRASFALANTLADAGRHAEAVAAYVRIRGELADDEQAFYASYRLGLSRIELGELELGREALLDAYGRRPSRAEPLVALARSHRLQGENAPAFRWARRAEALELPGRERTWLELGAYGGEPLLERSITAFYVGEHELGLDACERLLADRDPACVRDGGLTARNALYYLPKQSQVLGAGEIPVSRELRARAEPCWGLAGPNTTEYLPKNPAVVRLGGRVLVNVSLVNYHHERGRLFRPNDPDGISRTRAAILEWDPVRATVESERESRIVLPDGWHEQHAVRGLEDQRWAVHAGQIWLTATTYHGSRARGPKSPQVVLGRLADDLGGIAEIRELDYEGALECEKNWLPWSLGDRLLLLYSYDPLVVLEVDTSSARCREVTRWTPPFAARRWRGGAPPVAFPGSMERWLMLVHETVWLDDATVYLQRFVELGVRAGARGELEIRTLRFSRLFAFDHHGVEYATGLLDAGDGSLIVTFGSEEREARWARFAWDSVERLLAAGPADGAQPFEARLRMQRT